MKLHAWFAAACLIAATTPAAAQQRIDRPGTVAHAPAGAHFPERVGEFRRTSVMQFDQAGRDVAASYELERADGRMLLTVYVYPARNLASTPGSAASADVARANLCRQELNSVGQIIENHQQYRGARRTEQGGAPAVQGVDRALSLRSVHQFTSAFDDREQQVRSETDLYCYVGGDWLVKYRATSNADFDAANAIEHFIRNGPWPGRNPPPTPDETAMAPTRVPARG